MKLDTIIKCIEGEVSSIEKNEIETWLAENPANKDYLERVKKAWLAVDELRSLSQINVRKDWDTVEKRISQKSVKFDLPAKSNRIRIMFWIRIAAVFILGIIVASLFFNLKKDFLQNNQVADSYYEFNVPEGQKSDLVLPDGTKVQVNAGSKLSIPKQFSETRRELWMEGEAYFEVKKDALNPFLVHTSDINIKVLGTVFNVRAYSDEQLIETTLVEGKVMLNQKAVNRRFSEQITELEPNHKAIFLKNGDAKVPAATRREFQETLKVGEILISEKINTEMAISWTRDKLIFDNEYFDIIANRLEKYYGMKIRFEDERLKDLKFTGTLKKVSIEQTLMALQLTTPFNYKIDDSEIVLTKK